MTEKELVTSVINYFSKWFIIDTEVYDDSKKYRIDLIFKCKKTSAIFGIECKKPNIKRGKDAGNIVTQSMRYSLCNFYGRRIPIFVCPQLSKTHFVAPIQKIEVNDFYNNLFFKDILKENYINQHNIKHFYIDRHNSEDSKHHTFNGFICSLNIGEISKHLKSDYNTYYHFTFCNQVIFSTEQIGNEIIGLHQVNYDKLLTKIAEYDLFI